MFVEIFEGHVRDAAGLRTQIDRWAKILPSGALGWLGATGGIADDGTAILVARFASEVAIVDYLKEKELDDDKFPWGSDIHPHIWSQVTIRYSAVVDTFGKGGTDNAGFVQVIQGRGNRDNMVAEQAALDEFLARTQPDVHGGIVAWHEDGAFTQVVYFASEAEARDNEQVDLPTEGAERFGKVLADLEMERYIDLRHPWLYSA